MRRERMLGFSAVFALSLFVLHGVASAQAERVVVDTKLNVGLTQKVSLTPAEQHAQGREILVRIVAIRGVVRRMLEESRSKRDVVKTLCLDDKLNQIDVALRNARDRNATLGTAVQRNDVDLASHEFTVLGVLRERAERLMAEANLCVGKEIEILAEAALTTTIDPDIADDPLTDPSDPIIIIPPPPVSVIQ